MLSSIKRENVRRKKIVVLVICVLAILACGMIIAKRIQSQDLNKYKEVVWSEGANFTAGDCDSSNYNAWCPHNLQYDKTRNKFVFLQSHRTNHMADFLLMTLCFLNPEDPLEYEELNCPFYSGLGALLIDDDGTWYIWTDSMRYESKDAGKTWKERKLKTPLPTRYGVYKINDTLYMGDDSNNPGVYRVSVDGGITWEEKNFGVPYADCEASFCEFQGEIYAFLRTNTTEYACVLVKEGEQWKCVSKNDIKAGRSNCSPVAFEDYIAIAHINRYDCHLYYTVWDGEKEFKTSDLGQIEISTAYEGDCHSPAMAFGNGYVGIAFMMHMYGTDKENYLAAQNSWIVGTYEKNKDTIVCKERKEDLLDNDAKYMFEANKLMETLSIFPDSANIDQDNVIPGYIKNDNNYAVSLYNPDSSMYKYRTISVEGGGLIPVCNGKLIAYGTQSLTISPSDITLDYIKQYQPYCIVQHKRENYICLNCDAEDMMISLQRRNTVYESSDIIDCFRSKDINKIIYIRAHSYVDISGTLYYVEIAKEEIQ